KKYADDFPSGLGPVARRLVARRRTALRRLRAGTELTAIERSIGELRDRVREWPIRKDGFSCLEPGLRRIYRKGRKDEAKAYDTRDDDDIHEWRKRAKDLRYDVDLLEKVWPGTMKDVGKTLHDLTDRLGDDHDLAELRRVLSDSSRLTAGARHVPRAIELIDRRRRRLQRDARVLGDRIYSEKPKAFTRRIRSYWQAWRSPATE